MFGHVTKLVTAYHHGELSAEDRRRVDSHVGQCERCRVLLNEIGLTTQLLEGFASGPLESGPATARHGSALPKWIFASATALALVIGVFAWRQWSQDRIPTEFRLGQWLNISSEVTLNVSNIGQVRLEPKTRLRLVEEKPTEHRIQMERGTMHAMIWAPPRLFFVDTPSATAIDLGCAYTLTVDDHGDSLLIVTVGQVELTSKERSSVVRAGWIAKTRKGAGPGTPYLVESTEAMKQAIDTVDFATDASERARAVDTIVQNAIDNDMTTLWHLLPRVDASSRKRIYDKMLTFTSPPEGVTTEGVINLNPQMMELWKKQIGLVW